MAKAEPKFETEAELCAAFIEDMKTQRGWIVYPETAGFDILLVREDTGHQLGVHDSVVGVEHDRARHDDPYADQPPL